MDATRVATQIRRRLTDDPQLFIGQDIEFSKNGKKYRGPIRHADTVIKKDGTFVGVFMQALWMIELPDTAQSWTNSTWSQCSEVYISASDLSAAEITEMDDEVSLSFPDGSLAVLLPDGNNLDPRTIDQPGY
jgi:hypothetical protein